MNFAIETNDQVVKAMEGIKKLCVLQLLLS